MGSAAPRTVFERVNGEVRESSCALGACSKGSIVAKKLPDTRCVSTTRDSAFEARGSEAFEPIGSSELGGCSRLGFGVGRGASCTHDRSSIPDTSL